MRLSNGRVLVESSRPKICRVRVGYANMRVLGHSLVFSKTLIHQAVKDDVYLDMIFRTGLYTSRIH